MKFTTPRERYDELQRELDMRRNVYPRWKGTGKIKEQEANHRINCLVETMEDLLKLYPNEINPEGQQTTLPL